MSEVEICIIMYFSVVNVSKQLNCNSIPNKLVPTGHYCDQGLRVKMHILILQENKIGIKCVNSLWHRFYKVSSKISVNILA